MRQLKICGLILGIQLLFACGKGEHSPAGTEPDKDRAVQAMKTGGMTEQEISELISKEGDSAYSPRFSFKFLTGPTPLPHPEDPAPHARVTIYKGGVAVLKGETDDNGRITFLFSEWGELPSGNYVFIVDYFGNGGPYPTHCYRQMNNYDGSGYWIRVYAMSVC